MLTNKQRFTTIGSVSPRNANRSIENTPHQVLTQEWLKQSPCDKPIAKPSTVYGIKNSLICKKRSVAIDYHGKIFNLILIWSIAKKGRDMELVKDVNRSQKSIFNKN